MRWHDRLGEEDLPGGIRGLQIRREVVNLSLVGSTPTLSAITCPDN